MHQKKNSAISCCRVVSMLMIVLCHIIGRYTFIPGHAVLSNILNVGVYTFLAMSGYLYGSRTIRDIFPWLRKRFVAVVFPAWVLAVCVILAESLAGIKNSPVTIVMYLLGAQGLGFVFPGFYRYFTEIKVMGPLWFITVIMLCYCMIPLLQKCRKHLAGGKRFCLFVLLGSALCCGLVMKNGVVLFYSLTFAIGYFLSAGGYCCSVHKSTAIGATVLMLASQVLRLVLQVMCDGTPIYQTYTYLSHMILGVWIMYFFLMLQQMAPALIDRLAESRAMTVADSMSMYVFLTHYCFCQGMLNMYRIFDNLLIATLAFSAATLLSAWILKKLVEALTSVLKLHK